MADRGTENPNRRAVIAVSGASLVAPWATTLAHARTGSDGSATEAALVATQDIVANAQDVDSVANKLNRDGSNVADSAAFRVAVGLDQADNVSFHPAGTGAIARSLQAYLRDQAVKVTDYGIDTAAIESAWSIAKAQRRALYFPSENDRVYRYEGTGLTGTEVALIGDGPWRSVILIADGKHLIDDPDETGSLLLQGIRFVGGVGVYRSRYTGPSVKGIRAVRDCEFLDYTGAALSHNSSDCPLWTIQNNRFRAAGFDRTIGIALKGLTDSTGIVGNSFEANQVHIKMGDGGNNAYIAHNTFFRIKDEAPTGARCDIWCVPKNTPVNSGAGLHIGPNKFGNEFKYPGDIAILYADEGGGSYFGDRLPNIYALSNGYITGHTVDGSAFYNSSHQDLPHTPVVYSTTPNVYGCRYSGVIGGTLPSYILEFMKPPVALMEGAQGFNIIGPFTFATPGGGTNGFESCNSYNTVIVVDPAKTMGGNRPSGHKHHLIATATGLAAATTTNVGPTEANALSDTTGTYWRFARAMRVRGWSAFSAASRPVSGGSTNIRLLLEGEDFPTAQEVIIGDSRFRSEDRNGDGMLIPAGNRLSVQINVGRGVVPGDYVVVIELEEA